jgi:hypothetical protein
MTQTIRSNARLGLWAVLIALTALGVPTSAQSRWDGSGVTVYADPNFSGQTASFRDDTPNMVPYNLNDKISSIQIPTGDTWEVCQDVDYGNRCQVLSSSVVDLRSIGWNDRISSLRRTNDNNGRFRDRRSGGRNVEGVGQGVVFYAQNGYRGASMLVTTASSNMGFPARQGSVQLRGGGAWEVCDGSGRCATIDQDVSNVSRLGLNGHITSVRPVNSSAWERRNRGIGRNR